MKIERFPQRVVRFHDHGPVSEPARGLPLAFVHINKTAGTTFTEYLRAHFLGPSAVAAPFFGDYDAIGVNDDSCELYWGHFPLAQFAQHRPDAWFITFLRDPVDRVVSQYRSLHNPANVGGGWEKVLPTAAREALEFAQQASFEEFVTSDDPFIIGHLQDLQTRFLTSYPDPRHPEFLTSALHNLEHRLLFFGSTERFDESIELFRFQLSSRVPYRAETHRRNVSKPYSVDVTPAAADRVGWLVQNDWALYRRAVELLDQRVRLLRQVAGEPRIQSAA